MHSRADGTCQMWRQHTSKHAESTHACVTVDALQTQRIQAAQATGNMKMLCAAAALSK